MEGIIWIKHIIWSVSVPAGWRHHQKDAEFLVASGPHPGHSAYQSTHRQPLRVSWPQGDQWCYRGGGLILFPIHNSSVFSQHTFSLLVGRNCVLFSFFSNLVRISKAASDLYHLAVILLLLTVVWYKVSLRDFTATWSQWTNFPLKLLQMKCQMLTNSLWSFLAYRDP